MTDEWYGLALIGAGILLTVAGIAYDLHLWRSGR